MIRFFQALVLLVALAGLPRLKFGNDLSRFHQMDPLLAQGEQAVAAAVGGLPSRFQLVELSAWQRENAELKAAFGETLRGEFLTAADLPSYLTLAYNGVEYLLLPSDDGLDVKGELTALFDRCAAETRRLLMVASLFFLTMVALVWRRQALRLILPVVAAVAATAGTLGWLGEEVNFFQLLAFFILAGLGIDYAIFQLSGRVNRVVFFSFLTTLAGLGMLAFTSFQVTRSMGITLACGIFYAYFLALPGRPGAFAPRGELGAVAPSTEQGGSGGHLDLSQDKGEAVSTLTCPVPKAKAFGLAAEGETWYSQREQSAGVVRMNAMWLVYRLLGKNVAKLVATGAVLLSYPFAKPARRALAEFQRVYPPNAANARAVRKRNFPLRVMLNFAWSLLDKVDAASLGKNLPKMRVTGDRGWMQGGCFIISTHVGCIETLPALGSGPLVHAFRQLGHDQVFTRVFTRHLDRSRIALHAVEDIGVETAVEMRTAIERGEIVLMAGDRPSAGSAAVLRRPLFDRECRWPKGVFRFAKLMDAPVWALAAVRTGWNEYEVRSARLGGDLIGDYLRFLEQLALEHPEQWYHFYRFFSV